VFRQRDVVHRQDQIRMLRQRRGGECCVVRAGHDIILPDNGRREGGCDAVDARIVVGQLAEQVGAQPGAGAAAERVQEQEALERVAGLSLLADSLQQRLAVLGAEVVSAARPVVAAAAAVGQPLRGSEQPGERASEQLAQHALLHVDQHRASTQAADGPGAVAHRQRSRRVSARVHVLEEARQRLVVAAAAAQLHVLAQRLLPEAAAHLVAALANLQRDHLSRHLAEPAPRGGAARHVC